MYYNSRALEDYTVGVILANFKLLYKFETFCRFTPVGLQLQGGQVALVVTSLLWYMKK